VGASTLSYEPLRSCSPFGLKQTQFTVWFPCAWIFMSSRPLVASRMRTLPSRHAVASRCTRRTDGGQGCGGGRTAQQVASGRSAAASSVPLAPGTNNTLRFAVNEKSHAHTQSGCFTLQRPARRARAARRRSGPAQRWHQQ